MKKIAFVLALAIAMVTLSGCSSQNVVVHTTTTSRVDFSQAYVGTHTAILPIGSANDASTIESVLNAFELQEHVRVTSWNFESSYNGGLITSGTGVMNSLLVTFVKASELVTSTQ
jgi:uncharacterized protein YceK